MQLSPFGRVASAQWQQLPYRFLYLELGEWVIMPNHIHGILVISRRGEASSMSKSGDQDRLSWEASPLPHIFRIFFPILRICLDVIGDRLKLSLVTNDMLEIISLPN